MSIEIRPATFHDLNMLEVVAVKLIKDLMHLRPDKSKLRHLMTAAISSKSHYLVVAEDERGFIVGAMLTVSDQFMFAEKMYAQIICIHATVPTVGSQLLEDTMKWVEKRKGIQLVSYSMPVKTDVDKLLLKNNFEDTGSMLVWRRYEFSK